MEPCRPYEDLQRCAQYPSLPPVPRGFTRSIDLSHRRLVGRHRRLQAGTATAAVAVALGAAWLMPSPGVAVGVLGAVAAVWAAVAGLVLPRATPRSVDGGDPVPVLADALAAYGVRYLPASLVECGELRAAGVDAWLAQRCSPLEREVVHALAGCSSMTIGRLASACRLGDDVAEPTGRSAV